MNEQVDSIVEAVRADLLRRSQIGIKKYGTTLDRSDLSLRDWLQHSYEETLDVANYLKRAITEASIGEPDKTTPRGIDVLDHGFVRLIDAMGTDISVVRAARVSHDAAWRAGEDEGSDARLIDYLWRNKYTTPFEAVTLTFEVHAPIFVFRQWHRHRTWSFNNELSARYRPLPETYYVPKPEQVGQQATKNKQGRECTDLDRTNDIAGLRRQCEASFAEYKKLLGAGWPRELARIVLPLNTYSHMFATVNLLNLMKFLTSRCDEHAQYEIRVYADAMRELARAVAPVCIGAWERHNKSAATYAPVAVAWSLARYKKPAGTTPGDAGGDLLELDVHHPRAELDNPPDIYARVAEAWSLPRSEVRARIHKIAYGTSTPFRPEPTEREVLTVIQAKWNCANFGEVEAELKRIKMARPKMARPQTAEPPTGNVAPPKPPVGRAIPEDAKLVYLSLPNGSKIIDRNLSDPCTWDYLRRLQMELNHTEWTGIECDYQWLYSWIADESKYRLRSAFQKNWGPKT